MLKRIILGIVLMALSLAAIAQTGARRLRPEDVLRIQVFNQQQIVADVPVDPSGNVTAPFVGTIRAEGRTIDELIAELTRLYRERLFLKDPIVSVTLVNLRPLRATVGGGGVARPGTWQIRPGDTVLNLLNQGGGAIRDVADLKRAYLRRAGTLESIPVDLYALTVFGDVSQNYEVQDGDELVVPEARGNQLLVLGAVQRPGLYPYREPTTAWEAIGLAGGEIRFRSRFSRTVVLRQRQGLPGQYVRIPIDLVRFIRKGDSTQNIQLQPGDIIFVPETNTPDFQQIGALANTAFILDRLGGSFFGLNIFGR
ncbi:polysaccharide export protein [bacterium]|nr:MAG: polysaccharide export protein [bacterium]